MTPQPIIKPVRQFSTVENSPDLSNNVYGEQSRTTNISTIVKVLEKEIKKAAKEWDFEKASRLKRYIENLLKNKD